MERFEELFVQDPGLERLLRPSPEELSGLTESIRQLRTPFERDPDDMESAFLLAAALISHSRQSFVQEGVNILETLVWKRWQSGWSDVVQSQKGPFAPPKATDIARGRAAHATAPPLMSDSDDVSVSSTDDDHDESTATTAPTAAPSAKPPLREASPPPPPTANASAANSTSPLPASATARADSQAPQRQQQGEPEADDLGLYHYYLTIGWIKLKRMHKASSCIDQMLLLMPHNKQGQSLRAYVDVALRQERAVDVGKVAGITMALAGAATAVGFFFSRRE